GLDGGRVASVRDIASEHRVSIVTAARALRLLRDRGLVRTVARSGCFVAAGRTAAAEQWALCQRVTSGTWQRASASLFRTGFEAAARKQGFTFLPDLLAIDADATAADLRRQVAAAAAAGVGGVFFLPSRVSEAALKQDETFLHACRAANLPVVLLERNLRGTGRPLERDLVASDDAEGGLLCTRHLLDIGRRRVAFVTGSPCSSHDDRVAGYLLAMHQAGAAADWRPEVLVQPAGLSEAQTHRDLADRVLDLRADGVICYEDYTALGLILELLARGVRVPGDVAVAGFDDLPIGSAFTVGVTTYALAYDRITRHALRVMRERVRHPDRRPVKVVVPGRLVVRESTAGVRNCP
ncbi:MAG TPA: substrate-binding domain-containing protein, partial [Gemmataceae bacterium]